MRKLKKIFICLGLVASLSLVACSDANSNNNNSTNSSSTNNISADAPLLLTGETLSFDNRILQMRADAIVANNGYLDSDQIVAIVELSNDSILDTYNDSYATKYDTVNEFEDSYAGQTVLNKIKAQQKTFIEALGKNGYDADVLYKYQTVINAVAVKTTYGTYKNLSKIYNVKSTMLSETFNLPQAEETSSTDDVVTNVVDVYEDTGIFRPTGVDFTGVGTAVAILDSGFDTSHTVFASPIDESSIKINQDFVGSVLANTNAYESTEGLIVNDVYYKAKIPFAYDYADGDADVNPSTSNHGTHVAGIIGGSDEVITGVAVDTQLVLMKVFEDEISGATTEHLLAALEDSVDLQVDAINMSLGTSCGFATEYDDARINEVYNSVANAGISLICAASNSYSAGFGGENGNTNMVTNPDSGTVGSPSTYGSSLSVASISGVKSRYFVVDGTTSMYYIETSSNAETQQNFFQDLGITETESIEYVVVPGYGLNINYASIDVKGKIAIVSRGSNSFEEKVRLAAEHGARACIVYNNVAGTISMSVGAADSIPSCSITKDNGRALVASGKGTLTFSPDYQAGPFMSEFSSWGPTPSLTLKPEITAHGGTITSSVPGGGYDELSGTSMASPNMCGVIVLLRQYINQTFPDYTAQQKSALAYQLLMSTATIALDEYGVPYSPRKQGAGLASLSDAANTQAYLTVDGSDKTKIELGDDPTKSGEYKMQFNIVNFSNSAVSYDLSVIGMTETVESSDTDYVAQREQLIEGLLSGLTVENGSNSGLRITVQAGQTAKVSVDYTISGEVKELIDSLFPNGMYVEGFLVLTPTTEDGIDLNIPFLAFYGDWTSAPLFDLTYYDVESEAHNNAIDDEDKIKADYYATTPYGTYNTNYMIQLGSYVYTIDTTRYEYIPATEEHIAISDGDSTINGISQIYTGLLRNAKQIDYTITDDVTGEVLYTRTDYNAYKAYSDGGNVLPYTEMLGIVPQTLGLINNRTYTFRMEGLLDYGDGGKDTNQNNFFEFTFTFDNEAPIITNSVFEKVYDTGTKEYRYYLTLTVYDNHYAQSITPLIFTENSEEATRFGLLEDSPIPIYGGKNTYTDVRFEITEYLKVLKLDQLTTQSLAFGVDDYALNSNIYLISLPGTDLIPNEDTLKFTKDGSFDGEDLGFIEGTVGETIDLTRYLSSSDPTLDDDKDYLKYLTWTLTRNTCGAYIQDGIIYATKSGRVTVTVSDAMYTTNQVQASISLIFSESSTAQASGASLLSTSSRAIVDTSSLESLDFTYYETVYAHPVSSTTSDAGEIGSVNFINAARGGLSVYPGESIKLHYDLQPWYLSSDRYTLDWRTTNSKVATVDQEGVVTFLRQGSCYIQLRIYVDGRLSSILATIGINVQSEFIISGRVLVEYKGIGGNVVIPADRGITSIAPYAFSLYTFDNNFAVDSENPYANRVPGTNTTITSITIPSPIESVDQYAFANLLNLTTVNMPSELKTLGNYVFYNCPKLTTIDLSNVESIGRYGFYGDSSLETIDLAKIYSIGASTFENCTGLTTVDITKLRNTGASAFKGCTNLKTIKTNELTKLSAYMFENSGLTSLELDVDRIPQGCFKGCTELVNVKFNDNLIYLANESFANCIKLNSVTFGGTLQYLYDGVFNGCTSLETITLPNSTFSIGANVFYGSGLKTIILQENTIINNGQNSSYPVATLESVDTTNSSNYVFENGILYNTSKNNIVLVSKDITTLEVPTSVTTISQGAFSASNIESITFLGSITINSYAFSNATKLTTVTFASNSNVSLEEYAFAYCSKLTTVNLEELSEISNYAFYQDGFTSVTLKNGVVVNDYAFSQLPELTTITFLGDATINNHGFASNASLTTVNTSENAKIKALDYSFYDNAKLANIDLSVLNGTIGTYAFADNLALIGAVSLPNVTVIEDCAFLNDYKLTSLSVPNVVTIGDYAFSKNPYITTKYSPALATITFGSSLKSIGAYAFAYNNSINTLTLPEGLTSLSHHAFYDNDKLVTVNLPSTITEIEEYTFAGSNLSSSGENLLSSIDLSNVVIFGAYAFYNNSRLTSINLESARSIGDAAFANCTRLVTVSNTSNVETIGFAAFQSTSISSFDASNAEEIGAAAFSNSDTIKEITLSTKLSSYGATAVYASRSFANYYFMSNGEKVSDGKINDYAFLDNGILYTYMLNGNLKLTSVPAALNITTLEVQEGTTVVDAYAGNANTKITSIILPNSLTNIGNFAFYGYSALKSVEFRSYVAPTLESYYGAGEVLGGTEPGYEILNKYINLYQTQYYYYTFVNIAGENAPLSMILPSNETVVGYDNMFYRLFFGEVSNATRSDYIAMETNTQLYLSLITSIPAAADVKLEDDELITNCYTSYLALNQDLTNFNYTEAEITEMANKILDARKALNVLKRAQASQSVRDTQTLIDNLNTTFSLSNLESYRAVYTAIYRLSITDRQLLDLTNYNLVLTQYNTYISGLSSEVVDINNIGNSVARVVAAVTTSLLSVGALLALKKYLL